MRIVSTACSFFKVPDLMAVWAKQRCVFERIVLSVSVYVMNFKNFWNRTKSTILTFSLTESHESFSVDGMIFGWSVGHFFFVPNVPASKRTVFPGSELYLSNMDTDLFVTGKAISKDWLLFFAKVCWPEFLETFVVAILSIRCGFKFFSAWTFNCQEWFGTGSTNLDPVFCVAGVRAVPRFPVGARKEFCPTANTGLFCGWSLGMSGDIAACHYWSDGASTTTRAQLRAWASWVYRRVLPTWRVAQGSIFGHGFGLLCGPSLKQSLVSSSWRQLYLTPSYLQWRAA